ncbi:uncharacterized protein EI90DRAFT_3125633 [Cantharellus anzutake]|uniref:uncharacterized protein n=1 Tax=Cantharellus anzutake TaxID=1750568 RepID=UPI0019075C7E|nr:uncharacterized protein EI90DRAFT_3125633 [Cantharellus anzutake]KAF8328900.1 hypothetical protein EI90DRAFT_3125633 [Cantharellus anzutake]
MVQEATFNLTLRDSSPLWRWSNISNVSSAGWTVLCAKQTISPRCDEHEAHFTTAEGVGVQLTFTGTAIAVYANTTGGMEWAATLDGTTHFSNETFVYSQLLTSFSGLAPTSTHNLTIRITSAPSGSSMTFDRAEITVSTGSLGLGTTSTYIDDLDSSLAWKGFGTYPEYTDTVVPATIKNTTFHASNVLGETVSTTFTNVSSAVIVYGPCYLQCGPYNVSFDNDPVVSYNGSFPTITGIIAEQCVRYYHTMLDPAQQHGLTITAGANGRWTTLDWIEFVHASNFTTSNPTTSSITSKPTSTPSGGGGSHGSSNVGAIAGGVIGGLTAIIVVAFLLFLLCRRRAARSPLDPKHIGLSRSGQRSNGPDPSEGETTNGSALVASPASNSAAHTSGSIYPPSLESRSPVPPSTTNEPSSLSPFTASEWMSGTQRSPVTDIPSSAFRVNEMDYRPIEKGGSIRSPNNLNQSETHSAISPGVGPQPQISQITSLLTPATHSDHTQAYTALTSSTSMALAPSSGQISTPPASFPQNPSLTPAVQPPPPAQQLSSTGVPNLTQISMDVNRILTELGKLRVTPGEPVDGEDDPAFREGFPPIYGMHDASLHEASHPGGGPRRVKFVGGDECALDFLSFWLPTYAIRSWVPAYLIHIVYRE